MLSCFHSFIPTAQLKGTTGEKFCSPFSFSHWLTGVGVANFIGLNPLLEVYSLASHMHAICPHLCLPDLHKSPSIHQSMKGESIIPGKSFGSAHSQCNRWLSFNHWPGISPVCHREQKIDHNYQPLLPPSKDPDSDSTYSHRLFQRYEHSGVSGSMNAAFCSSLSLLPFKSLTLSD